MSPMIYHPAPRRCTQAVDICLENMAALRHSSHLKAQEEKYRENAVKVMYGLCDECVELLHQLDGRSLYTVFLLGDDGIHNLITWCLEESDKYCSRGQSVEF